MPLIPKQEPPYYEITAGEDGIKQYIALLTQTGTNNPGQVIIKDTIGINGWARDSAGIYKTAIISGAFPVTKTISQIQTQFPNNNVGIITSADQAQIITGATPGDDILDNTTVIITVYP